MSILLLVWNGRFYIGLEFYWTPGLSGTGEFSLANESPTIREGGYTAVRLADVGSLFSGCGCVAPAGTAAR